MHMTEDEVRRKVELAIDEFMEKDIKLLENKSSERSVTHRLAVYLEKQFQTDGWQVDCEYNRIDLDKKSIELRGLENRRRVFPDIIVHRRGEKQNLLAVEVKTGKTNKKNDELDRLKLNCYKNQPNLDYTLALFLKFSYGSTNRPEQEWI